MHDDSKHLRRQDGASGLETVDDSGDVKHPLGGRRMSARITLPGALAFGLLSLAGGHK